MIVGKEIKDHAESKCQQREINEEASASGNEDRLIIDDSGLN